MPIEKIVVLEDDLIVQKNLEQQLRQRRYEVSCATTLAAAQELLSRDTVDLLFVDIRLPDGEGTDLLRELQERPQKPLVSSRPALPRSSRPSNACGPGLSIT